MDSRGQNALTSVSRVEPEHYSANYFGNIVVGPSHRLFCGGYKGDISDGALVSNGNCFWSEGGKLPISGNPRSGTPGTPLRISWAAWRKAGHDALSVVADPMITEGKKTWRLAKNSPVWKLGFKQWDWSKCGSRPRPCPRYESKTETLQF